MTIEVIVLALASTIRPTSLAAVYALVSSDSPRRLMTAYTVAGLAFTVAFGLLVVWAFSGIDIRSGTSTTKDVAELGGGIVALAFGLLVLTGHVAGPRADDAPDAPGRWRTILERRLTFRTATLAGPITHIPGVFYLLALNVIVAHEPRVFAGLVLILIYNVIWFAVPIAALAACIVRPEIAGDAVSALDAWTRRHTRPILLSVSFVVGIALILDGALTL